MPPVTGRSQVSRTYPDGRYESGLLSSARSLLPLCRRGLTDDGILRTEPPEDAMSEQARLDVIEGRVEELSRHWDRLFGEMSGSIRRSTPRRRTVRSHRRARSEVRSAIRGGDRQFIDLRAELSKQFRWTFSTMLALAGDDADRRRGCGDSPLAELSHQAAGGCRPRCAHALAVSVIGQIEILKIGAVRIVSPVDVELRDWGWLSRHFALRK